MAEQERFEAEAEELLKENGTEPEEAACPESGEETEAAAEQPDTEEETLATVKEFGIMDKTTFTSFTFPYIEKIKALDPTARVGWLTSTTDDEAIMRLRTIGGEKMAPKAETITPELMEKWRNAGFGVRAWGVSNVALMKKMCKLGVDGMTVNFPDRLFEYLRADMRG